MNSPNILFIVSDDHGYADRSAMGIHDDVHTPNLDRLAAEGVTCTNAYVTAPICSPSRSGMITGQYQQRWGGLWFDSAQFPPDASIPTLAEMLGEAGYRTGYFGKVHYGPEKVGDRACPPHHGFEETLYGLAGQSMGRLNYLRHSRDAQEEYGEEPAFRMAVQPLLSGDEPVEYEGFLTEKFGSKAREFIAADDARPFFCMLAFNAVHNFCWQLPPEELAKRGLPAFTDWDGSQNTYGEWYDDVIVPNLPHGREYYLAQLELMDEQIGAILDLLDETGQAENTIVIYLTDNGGSTCNFGDNSPLRGTKYTLCEGGMRVPMIWRWPNQLPAGTDVDVPASSLDLMPTFRAAVGAPTDDRNDGINLLPALRGEETPQRPLHWDCGFQFAVRDGEWKLSWVKPDGHAPEELRRIEHAPMPSGWGLYHLGEDVAERQDRMADEPEIAERLFQLHEEWRERVGLGPSDRPRPSQG